MKITIEKIYKTTLCSNKKCLNLKPIEKYTFIAPVGFIQRKRCEAKTTYTQILRFCSYECKVEWLKNEYNKEK